MLNQKEYWKSYESFPFCATMNCVPNNAATHNNHHFALLLLLCGLCAAPCLTAQTLIQTPAQADSLRRVIATAKHDTTRVSAMNELSNYFREKKSQYDSAMTYAQEAQNVAERFHFRKGVADALDNIASVYRRQGKNAEALENDFKSLRIKEKIGDKSGIASSLHNIAMVYRWQGKNAEALDYNFKSLRIREEIGDKSGIANSLNNIANVYSTQGKYPQALENYFKTLRIDEEMGDKSGIASSMNNIGLTFIKTGQFKEAQSYLLKSLELKQKLGWIGGLPTTLNNLAISYRRQSKFDSAMVFSLRSLVLADSLGFKPLVKDALEELSLIMDSLGRHKESLAYFKRFMTVKDSLVNLENLNKTSQIKELYEAEKREQQIASQKTELNRKNIIQVILIGVLIIAVIFTFVFRSMYQNKNRANAEILRQQQTLENQALEIELANTTLHERNFLLEELDREKNEFLGIAAHDLKNPLASMRLNVSMLQRYGNRFTAEEQSASLQNMLTVIERMTAIITNLLDINALERGGMQFTILSFDIAPVVEAAVHQYRLPAEAKQLTLHFSQETPDNIVSADKQALMQVLDNLVSNAVKYSPHGKHVFVRILRNASAVRVEVQDEGEGISQEDMKKLFGKFARLSAQPSGGEHSTGLGLSIVKRMVEAMNGRVWCESELGKGATFIVELPIQSNLLNQVSSRIIS
jgi:signal transduction histidine kinase